MSKRKLTYEDFKRYFSNRQKPEEKHQFEKNMMQDAFDEEAFDGLSMLSEEELEHDIDTLKNKIHQRTSRRNKTVFLYLKYAAGIAIIIGLGFSTLYFFDRNLKSDIAESKPVRETMALADSAPPNEEKAALENEKTEAAAAKQQAQKNETTQTKSAQPKKVIDELEIINEKDDFMEMEVAEDISDDEFDIDTEKKEVIALESEEAEEESNMILEEMEETPIMKEEPEPQSKTRMEDRDETDRKRNLKLFGKNNKRSAKGDAAAANEALSGNAMPQSQGYTALENRNAAPPNNWVMDTLENKLIKEIKKRFDLTNETYKVEMILTIDTQGQIASITHEKELPEDLKSLIRNILDDIGTWQAAIKNGQIATSEVSLKLKLKD